MRLLSQTDSAGTDVRNYCLTLGKASGKSLEARLLEVYSFFREAVTPNERFSSSERGYRIEGPGYSLTYFIEAYGKNGMYTGYTDGSTAHADFLHRMSVEQACYRIRRTFNKGIAYLTVESDILPELENEELISRYDYPADRFIAAYKRLKDKMNVEGKASEM